MWLIYHLLAAAHLSSHQICSKSTLYVSLCRPWMYHPTSKKTITKTNRPKINENNGLIWASCQSRGKYNFREHAELYLCIKNRKVGGKYNLTKSSLIALATAFLVDAVLFGIFCSSASTIVRSYSIKGCHWSNTQKAPNIQWKKYKRTVLFLGTM